MSQIKNIMAVFIVSVSLLGAYFIIKNSDQIAVGNGSQISKGNDKSLLESGKTLLDFITEGSDKNLDDASANAQLGGENIDQSNSNLTDALAQTFFSQMLITTGGDLDQVQKADLDNEEIKKVLQASLADIPQTIFDPAISDADIKISEDNSDEAKNRYFEKIFQIVSVRFGENNYTRTDKQTIADISADCFTGGDSLNPELAQLYKNLASDYLAVPVPSQWADLHKRMIGFFEKSNLIYDALSGCKNDIVKGYAAAQTVPDLMSEEKSIQDMMIQKSKELSSAYFNHV